jgi:hypothetical protein
MEPRPELRAGHRHGVGAVDARRALLAILTLSVCRFRGFLARRISCFVGIGLFSALNCFGGLLPFVPGALGCLLGDGFVLACASEVLFCSLTELRSFLPSPLDSAPLPPWANSQHRDDYKDYDNGDRDAYQSQR